MSPIYQSRVLSISSQTQPVRRAWLVPSFSHTASNEAGMGAAGMGEAGMGAVGNEATLTPVLLMHDTENNLLCLACKSISRGSRMWSTLRGILPSYTCLGDI